LATPLGLAGQLCGSASSATDRAVAWIRRLTPMATLQLIKNAFHIRFRFGGRPFRRSLGTVGRDEAENTRMQVEVNLYRIKVGVIPPPPHEADVPLYVMTGGKEGRKPTTAERPVRPVPSLKELWDDYLASLPTGAKEES